MPNILYLSYDGLTDPLGKSQILPYLHGLASLGHQITVISFEKKGGAGYLVLEDGIKSIPLKYHKSPPVFSTLYDLYLLKKQVKMVVKTNKIDIVHCRSYVTALVGLWAKQQLGVKFIFDMRGFWANERVEGGVWNLKNPVFHQVYRFFKNKEKQFIAESDAVISLTNNAKQEICSWEHLNSIKDKIHVIPTCADLHHFSNHNVTKIQCEALRKTLGIKPEDRVLLYLGSLGTWYMLEEMLDFYEALKSKGNYKFLFLTKDQVELSKALEKRNFAQGDIIVTSCDRSEVPAYISLCEASIFFIIPTYSKKASAATKMGEIMAMGKPVITNSGWGDVEEIIDGKNGILVRNFDLVSYQESIELYPINPESTYIRKTAEKYYSLDKGVLNFHHIYIDLVNTDSAKPL